MHQSVRSAVYALGTNQDINFPYVPKGKLHKAYLCALTTFPLRPFASFHETIPLLWKNYLDIQLSN